MHRSIDNWNSYKDQIVCDVLEMDVCHILLERSWRYDTQALHNGRENAYEFQWMDKKIVLLPQTQKENESVNSKKSRCNHLFVIISVKKLLKEMDKEEQEEVGEKEKRLFASRKFKIFIIGLYWKNV